MIHDLNKVPTLKEMHKDYEAHCTKKVWDGITYYVHGRSCQCWNCEKTREQQRIDFPGIHFVMPCKVTVNDWRRDRHGYQEFGTGVTETEAVQRAIKFVGKEI